MEQITINQDTIVAVSTPSGVGAIALVRISGPQALAIVHRCWRGKNIYDMKSHTAHLGYIVSDNNDEYLDQVVLTLYLAPNSFTGEDIIEIACHGSVWIQREIVSALVGAGARPAIGGEFSSRAFANGKLDLAQTEGIADLIASTSRAAHRVAMTQMRGHFSRKLSELRASLIDLASLLELELDFSEEDVEFASRTHLLNLSKTVRSEITRLHDSFSTGNAIKNGIPVAIIGATNAGKSSLLNNFLGDDKAIVSDIHGTTRDVIEDTAEIDGFLFRFMDTAGIRETDNHVEQLGIERSYATARKSRIILLVVDASISIDYGSISTLAKQDIIEDNAQLIVVFNKIDKIDNPAILPQEINNYPVVGISAKNGDGIDNLRQRIVACAIDNNSQESDIIITNARHALALKNAKESIEKVIGGLQRGISGDFIAQDIRETTHYIGEITGEITTDSLLSNIFSKFCIGK